MTRAGRALLCAFLSAAFLMTFGPAAGSPAARASTPCAVNPYLSADLNLTNAPDNSNNFDTAQHVIDTFNWARQQEGCTNAIQFTATQFANATPQQQVLMLYNDERAARGVQQLTLDTNLLSQIALNHDREEMTYGPAVASGSMQFGYFDHPSPINRPGGSTSVGARFTADPATSSPNSYSEDIAYDYFAYSGSPPSSIPIHTAVMVFGYLYQDSGSNWGHRQAILGESGCDPTTKTCSQHNQYNWVGIGELHNTFVYNGFTYDWERNTSDFYDFTNYQQPATADTTPPTMSAPTFAGGTATVQNVADTPPDTGESGVTGVVFYVNAPMTVTNCARDLSTCISCDTLSAAQNCLIQTYPGTKGACTASGCTWSAQGITVNAGDTLHAVAVDGSGNFTDCAVGGCSVTASYAARFIVHRSVGLVTFHWKMARPMPIAGFDVLAGRHRLNARLIPVHRGPGYVFQSHYQGRGKFALHVILRTGQGIVVPAS